MASSMWGADPTALDELARALLSSSERLDAVTMRLRAELGAAPWHGPDSERFRTEWRDRHEPALSLVSRLLAETSTRVAGHAEEQRTASAGTTHDSVAVAGGAATAAGATSWLAARAAATRSIMERDLADLRRQLAEEERNSRWSLVENVKGVAPGMATDGEILRSRIERLQGYLDSGRTFLTFSDQPGDQRIVEVHGDLATASRVILHVPGIGTDLGDYDSGGHADALSLFDEAQNQAGGGVAVISFLDYNVPTGGVGPLPDVFEAANAAGAASGTTALRALVQELSDQGQPVSVVAHSYGTLLVGEAMKQGLTADVVVALGSPGMGSDTRLGLGSENVTLYAGSSPVDPLAAFAINPFDRIESVGDYVTYAPPFGDNPIEYANRLDVVDAHGHSSYFEGQSLVNVVGAALSTNGGG